MKRNILAVSSGLLVLAALVGLLVLVRPTHPTQALSQAEFVSKTQSNLIARVQVKYDAKGKPTGEVRGTFYQTDAAGQIQLENGKPTELPFSASVFLTNELLDKLLENTNFTTSERLW